MNWKRKLEDQRHKGKKNNFVFFGIEEVREQESNTVQIMKD